MSMLRRQTVGGGLIAVLIGISAHGAVAQSALNGTILSGASMSSGTGASSRLVLGARIASPASSWTEIVFSDGSSIVLGPGAALTVQRIAPGQGSAGNRISATGSGQIRVAAMDGTQIEVATAEAAITVVAADAVLHAGPHGSVAMMGGREVVVSQGFRQDTLRRPGFSVPLDGSGPRRDSNRQLAAVMAPFASSDLDRSPVAAAPTPARPAPSVKLTLRLASVQAAAAPTEIAATGSTDLTTGLTAQSGSFTSSSKQNAIARVAPSVLVAAPIIPVVTPSPAPNKTIPDIPVAPFMSPPSASDPAPASAVPAQSSFVPIDSALLAKFPNASGSVTLPGTTTSVSAGLVPSNEHLTWGFDPVGSNPATATSPTNPGVTFSIGSIALPSGSLQSLTGTATYTGGMIGNLLATSGTARPTGQFAQIWNFGTRTGAINAVFDGSTWHGLVLTTQPGGLIGFSGSGTSTTDQRSISFSGNFYNSTPVTSRNLPGAVGGFFFVGGSSTGRSSTPGLFVGTQR